MENDPFQMGSSLKVSFFCLFLFLPSSFCAQDAMESLSEDVAEVKKVVVSIQASLLTSVRLLQGKQKRLFSKQTHLNRSNGPIEQDGFGSN